jgi:hypothetical protein
VKNRLPALEEENRQLKLIVAEQAVDIRRVEGGGHKKMVSPQMQREAVLIDAGGSRAERATHLRADGAASRDVPVSPKG